MVTKRQEINSLGYQEGKYYGLSTDVKPTEGIKNGDAFIEMDTTYWYLFHEENLTWRKQ